MHSNDPEDSSETQDQPSGHVAASLGDDATQRTDSAQPAPRETVATARDATGTRTPSVTAPLSSTLPLPSAARRKHFISDLNPEAHLLKRPIQEDARGRALPLDDMGIWIDKLEYDELVRQRNNTAPSNAGSATAHSATRRNGNRPSTTSFDSRPHSSVLGPLIDAYFSRIHPLLPLLDEAEFRTQHAAGETAEPLVHAMCLVIAKDPTAQPYLRLRASPTTLPPREFCTRLHASVLGALRAPCQYDKITLIRILALASLHSEGPDGAEEASMLLSQAMHHAQTLAIHLAQTNPDIPLKRLFWTLWILDRNNSVTNGRPVIMSDADIALPPFQPGESGGFPAFEALLKISQMLNQIIAFYRPAYPQTVTGWEEAFPGIEEIYDEVHGWDLPPSLHATLHIYYLAVAVLSHRSRSPKQIPRGTNSAIRQRLCASEIIKLMESPTHSQDLHALPFIPYAVSVALSVSYQNLRAYQFAFQQEDACAEFKKCTQLLSRLRRTWSSADTMAALAGKVWAEIERAPDLARFRITREAQRKAGERPRSPCAPDLNGNRMGLEVPADGAAPGPTLVEGAVGAVDGIEGPAGQQGWGGLFDGVDDVFATYLDPNYPVNLEDLGFLEGWEGWEYVDEGQGLYGPALAAEG